MTTEAVLEPRRRDEDEDIDADADRDTTADGDRRGLWDRLVHR